MAGWVIGRPEKEGTSSYPSPSRSRLQMKSAPGGRRPGLSSVLRSESHHPGGPGHGESGVDHSTSGRSVVLGLRERLTRVAEMCSDPASSPPPVPKPHKPRLRRGERDSGSCRSSTKGKLPLFKQEEDPGDHLFVSNPMYLKAPFFAFFILDFGRMQDTIHSVRG